MDVSKEYEAKVLYEQLAELNALFDDKGTFDINYIPNDKGFDWVLCSNDDRFNYPIGLTHKELYIGIQLMIKMIKYLQKSNRLYLGKMIQ